MEICFTKDTIWKFSRKNLRDNLPDIFLVIFVHTIIDLTLNLA